MKEILLQVLGICIFVGIPSSSFLMGIEFGSPQLKELLKEKSMLIRYSIAMFIIVPAIALLLMYLRVADLTIWAGLFMVSISPAMPVIVNTSKKFEGDSTTSLSWFILSLILSLFFIPVSILVAEKVVGLDLNVGLSQIFMKMLILFLLPLALGFLVNKILSAHLEKIKKVVGVINKIAMAILVIILLIISVALIVQLGLIPNLFILAFMIIALIVGLIFGSPEKDRGPILASSILMRFPAAAIVIAQMNGTMERHGPVIIAYMIFGILIITILNKLILKRKNAVN